MATVDLEAEFRQLVSSVGATLKPLGYRKNGKSFCRAEGENVSLIEFQRSTESNASTIRFTVNLGIISKELLRRWDPEKDITKETVWSAHLRERIGSFLPTPTDYWWSITVRSNISEVTAEISDLILSAAVPFLAKHSSDHALLSLWNTGTSPGLTDAMRRRNVAELIDAGVSAA